MEPPEHDPVRSGAHVRIDLQTLGVRVPLTSGEPLGVDPLEHRDDVVRRLLGRGLTPGTLTALLPDWVGLIDRIDAERRDR